MPKPDIFHSTASVGDYLPAINSARGRAATYGNVDRLRRVHVPGSFGTEVSRVPTLAYHDDTAPVGSATLTPDDFGLNYEAGFAKQNARVDEIKGLIRDGAIPAVSIGWVPMEEPWTEGGITYHPKSQIVELSFVPIPANPLVTLQVASMMDARRPASDILEVFERHEAVGKRNSRTDAGRIQQVHDLAGELGAGCSQASARKLATAIVKAGPLLSRHLAQGSLGGLALAVDTAIDEAVEALQCGDVASGLALLTAAETTIDEILVMLGVADPDDSGSEDDGDMAKVTDEPAPVNPMMLVAPAQMVGTQTSGYTQTITTTSYPPVVEKAVAGSDPEPLEPEPANPSPVEPTPVQPVEPSVPADTPSAPVEVPAPAEPGPETTPQPVDEVAAMRISRQAAILRLEVDAAAL